MRSPSSASASARAKTDPGAVGQAGENGTSSRALMSNGEVVLFGTYRLLSDFAKAELS